MNISQMEVNRQMQRKTHTELSVSNQETQFWACSTVTFYFIEHEVLASWESLTLFEQNSYILIILKLDCKLAQ